MPVLQRRTTILKKKKSIKTSSNSMTKFRPQIRSRHPSHNSMRGILPLMSRRSIVRFGSTTDLPDTVTNGGKRVEVNTIRSIETSSSKKLMKTAFSNHKVRTAKWASGSDYRAVNADGVSFTNGTTLRFPVVVKLIYGSRGRGMKLANNVEEWNKIHKSIQSSISSYIMEEYHNYAKEYRLHVTEEGCFYTCRKMLKDEAPNDCRWYRNDSNCVWYIESNPGFDKPSNWNDIVKECVKALKACKLDIGACDVRVQSSKNNRGQSRTNPEFIIVEINSAPSFGEGTEAHYRQQLPKLIQRKINELK